jgi:hypothetical protein
VDRFRRTSHLGWSRPGHMSQANPPSCPKCAILRTTAWQGRPRQDTAWVVVLFYNQRTCPSLICFLARQTQIPNAGDLQVSSMADAGRALYAQSSRGARCWPPHVHITTEVTWQATPHCGQRPRPWRPRSYWWIRTIPIQEGQVRDSRHEWGPGARRVHKWDPS